MYLRPQLAGGGLQFGAPPIMRRPGRGGYLRGVVGVGAGPRRHRPPSLLGDWTQNLTQQQSSYVTQILGATSGAALDAVTAATAQYQDQPFYAHIIAYVAEDVAALQIDSSGVRDYATGTGNCSGQVQVNTGSIVAESIGTSLVKVAAATGPAAPFVAIAGGIVDLFGALFNPHAYAHTEESILCNAVPSANAQINNIASAVSGGQATPAQGITALNALLSAFTSAVAPIINHTTGNYAQTGDDAQFTLASLTAIVQYMTSQFQAQASAATAAAATAAASPTAQTPSAAGPATEAPTITTGAAASGLAAVPTWAWAAGVLALFFVLD